VVTHSGIEWLENLLQWRFCHDQQDHELYGY
jgi:hypothetical protein